MAQQINILFRQQQTVVSKLKIYLVRMTRQKAQKWECYFKFFLNPLCIATAAVSLYLVRREIQMGNQHKDFQIRLVFTQRVNAQITFGIFFKKTYISKWGETKSTAVIFKTRFSFNNSTMVSLEWSATNSCFTIFVILLPYKKYHLGCVEFFDISNQPTELP